MIILLTLLLCQQPPAKPHFRLGDIPAEEQKRLQAKWEDVLMYRYRYQDEFWNAVRILHDLPDGWKSFIKAADYFADSRRFKGDSDASARRQWCLDQLIGHPGVDQVPDRFLPYYYSLLKISPENTGVIQLLGRQGARAKAALPILKDLRYEHANARVRQAASEAAKKIEAALRK